MVKPADTSCSMVLFSMGRIGFPSADNSWFASATVRQMVRVTVPTETVYSV